MSKNIILKQLDRQSWSDFPVNTKVHGINGGWYLKVETGWKWWGSGKIFPRPSADWSKIELPFSEEEVEQSVKLFGNLGLEGGLKNCKHEPNDAINTCKLCGGTA